MAKRQFVTFDLPEQAAPGTPASGYGRLYVNTSGQLVFVDDAGTSLNLSTLGSGAVGYVKHGATAGTARPSGYAVVLWEGSVTPTNASNDDLWIDTA